MEGSNELISHSEPIEEIKHSKNLQEITIKDTLEETKKEESEESLDKNIQTPHWEQNINSIILKKKNEIRLLEKIKCFYHEEFEQNHLKTIEKNRFHQPIIKEHLSEEQPHQHLLNLEDSYNYSNLLAHLSSLSTYLSVSANISEGKTLTINEDSLSDNRFD